jgi:hypothetical protein
MTTKTAKTTKTKMKKKSAVAGKHGKPAPTEQMFAAIEALSDDLTDLQCDIDDAADARTLDAFAAAAAQAAKKLARVIAGMTQVVAKIDPRSYGAARQKATQLTPVPPPALPQ